MHRNPRSKGIKVKNILQVCLLLAVCFWLIFQVKRSHDKHKDFDATHHNIQSSEDMVKLGRKHLPSKLDTIQKNEIHEQEQEQEEEEEEIEEDIKHEEEEVDEDKVDEEKDDDIDQQKSDIEIEREEVDIIDEDKENEEESQTDTTAEQHTHDLREEHYKADDASSAVTHDGSRSFGTVNEIRNGTLDNSSQNVGQQNKSGPFVNSVNPASSVDFFENGPPSKTTVILQVSNSTYYTSNNPGFNETNVETDNENVIEETEEKLDPDEVQHLEDKEVSIDLEILPEIETEGEDSKDSLVE